MTWWMNALQILRRKRINLLSSCKNKIKQMSVSQEHFERHVFLFPAFAFKSGKYDTNLIKSGSHPTPVREPNIEPKVIKKPISFFLPTLGTCSYSTKRIFSVEPRAKVFFPFPRPKKLKTRQIFSMTTGSILQRS